MRPSKLPLVLGCALAAFLSAVFASQSVAQVVDDPQIYVCSGCTKPPGGDPNPLNTLDLTNVTMGMAQQSDHSQSPLLVIVAVPNGGAAPTLTLPAGVNFDSGTQFYGVTTSGSSTAQNAGTVGSGQNVYNVLNLSNANNSLSFVNMSGYDAKIGVTATSYTLYVWAVDYAMTGTTPLVGLNFSNVATGTFIAGYTCDTVPVSTTTECDSGNPLGATPFTNSGVGINNVPEPASMLLFGSGLVALGTKLRRKKQNKVAACQET